MTIIAGTLAVGTFFVAMVVHCAIARLFRRTRLFPQQLVLRVLFAVAAFNTALVLALAGPGDLFRTQLPFTLLVVLGSCHIYFHFFNMSETARRIRILLGVTSGKKLAPGAAADETAVTNTVNIRLKRLMQSRQIQKIGGRYQLRPSILLAASIFIEWYARQLFTVRNAPPRASRP
jgi:hypothetical protein